MRAKMEMAITYTNAKVRWMQRHLLNQISWFSNRHPVCSFAICVVLCPILLVAAVAAATCIVVLPLNFLAGLF